MNRPIVADTSNFDAKRNFIAFKAEVDDLEINKLVNVQNDLNNLKTKVDEWKSRNVQSTKVAPWCSGYHYCTTSFNKVSNSAQAQTVLEICDGENL